MFRFAFLAVLTGLAFAQSDPTPAAEPPAAVDQAVRTRINEFYNLLLAHQYRQAELMVADDTKDLYYATNKPQITKFEIVSVKYSEQFTRAAATTKCTQKAMMPGFPKSEIELPIVSLWKLENGNWYYYVDQSAIMSPVGVVRKVTPEATGGKAAAATAPGIPDKIPTTPDFVMGKVEADKSSLRLLPRATGSVTITNHAQGSVTIRVSSTLKDLEWKLDREDLSANQKAVLTLTAGKGFEGGTISLQLVPTGEVIHLTLEAK